jgi:hypothetical protein
MVVAKDGVLINLLSCCHTSPRRLISLIWPVEAVEVGYWLRISFFDIHLVSSRILNLHRANLSFSWRGRSRSPSRMTRCIDWIQTNIADPMGSFSTLSVRPGVTRTSNMEQLLDKNDFSSPLHSSFSLSSPALVLLSDVGTGTSTARV